VVDIEVNLFISMEEIYDSINLNRNTRRVLMRLDRAKLLPNDALRWLIHALDPFCDAEFAPCGFPDDNQAKSIVQVITKTMDVTKPDTIPTTTWDCDIVFVPLVIDGSEQKLFSYSFVDGKIGDHQLHTRELYPGVNVISCPADSDWLTDADCIHDNSVQFPVEAATGTFRLLAGGFEVHDVTSSLYRQGSVTSVTTDLGMMRGAALRNGPDEQERVEPFTFTRVPPTTLPSMAQYPGASTWASDLGVYNVWTMGDQTNQTKRLTSNQIAMYQEYPHSNGVYNYTGWTVQPQVPLECCVLPWNVSQSRFSGLNPESTLRITVKYYLERFPGPAETTLVSLARPPTDYCPLALELYSMALNHLDTYVPVGMNPLGEWFNKVIGALSTVAIPAGTALGAAFGMPQLGAIGGTLAKAGLDYISERNRRGRTPEQRLARDKREHETKALADIARQQIASKDKVERTGGTLPQRLNRQIDDVMLDRKELAALKTPKRIRRKRK
jgi:hypothetical protein